jgi:hypothetical protein
MNTFRHIGLIFILLMGFLSSAESALRPWEIYNPQEFSQHDRTLVQSLFTEGMEARGPGYIAHTFARFPADQRDSIVASTLQLRTPNMDYGKISHLMEQIFHCTDFSNRTLTVEIVQQLILRVGGEDSPWHHIQILRELPTPDAKRHFMDFVRHCSLFDNVSSAQERPEQEREDNDRMFLMRVLCESPDNDQRASLVACAARICGPNAAVKEQGLVMRPLVKISNNEDRDRFVTSVLGTGLLSLYEDDKDTVISALQPISDEGERNNVLEFLTLPVTEVTPRENLGF